MDPEGFKDLHEAIEESNLEVVKKLVQNHPEEKYFSHENSTALHKALSTANYEVAAYLIHSGAKFNDYGPDIEELTIDITCLNHLLSAYHKKSGKSCIFRLISYSRSPQGLDGERLHSVTTMYKSFFQSEVLKLLMMVLEKEDCDIVYDFCSEDINRMHRQRTQESEIYGLTLTHSKEIFIGAKSLLSGDSKKTSRVYGVVAEEMCHMVLTTLYQNGAKPYREDKYNLMQEFQDIVKAVHSLARSSCHIGGVIKDVFENYGPFYWESELIARIPHVIGIYGEEMGMMIFKESPELSRLLSFYNQKVIPQCKVYLDPSLDTKPHRNMERLVRRSEFMSLEEKITRPLREGFASFREYMVHEEGFSIISTNSIKMCTLHIYHELKREYEDILLKKCLFFTRKVFVDKGHEIRDALKLELWDYLIVALDEKELNLARFKEEDLDDYEEFVAKGMQLIVISGPKSLGKQHQRNVLYYHWDDLSEDFKGTLQHIRYIFKHEEHHSYIDKRYFQMFFNDEDILRMMDGDLIEIDDGKDLFSRGYISGTYVERTFNALTVDGHVFEKLPRNTNIFLTGMNKYNLPQFKMNGKMVQWLNGPEVDIQQDKSIFIVNKDRPMTFEEFRRRSSAKSNIWLHQDDKVFYLRKPDTYGDAFKKHLNHKTFSEKEILNSLRRNKIVLISDNAGYGKSTAISSLISAAKKDNDSYLNKLWIWRIDFNKFSTDKKDPLSIAHIKPSSKEEEVLAHFFLMIGFNTGLKKYLFREFDRYVFFDGFDEIPSKYMRNALKLLSTLREKISLKMLISTRKHHQEELENLLDTHSVQLVPFSREDQMRYLPNLWKSKLKYPNGEGINSSQKDEKDVPEKIRSFIRELKKGKPELELSDLVNQLERIDLEKNLKSVRADLDEVDFTKLAGLTVDKTSLAAMKIIGIPLYMYIIGIIYLNGYFNLDILSDIYSLYSHFIDQKILIYLEEKQGFWHDGREKDYMLKMRRKDAYRIHFDLAVKLIDDGTVSFASDMSEEDRELCLSLGIACIREGQVEFLHQTFPEFIIAESLRQELRKDIFLQVLSEHKFNGVRKFLSSALEKNKTAEGSSKMEEDTESVKIGQYFENLSEYFFRDVGFLVSAMEKLIDGLSSETDFTTLSEIEHTNLDLLCVLKIVKKLVEIFEQIVAEKDLVENFLESLHGLVMEKIEKGDSKEDDNMKHHWLGGCLTVYMLKSLLKRNSHVYSCSLITLARFSENPQEVINVFEEYISIETNGESEGSLSTKESKRCGDVPVLGLFTLKDSHGNGIICHALQPHKADIFACILKFFRDHLEKEEFIEKVIQTEEYRRQLGRSIFWSNPNGMIGLLKELHSLFRDETECLFHKELKYIILNKLLIIINYKLTSISLEEKISLFHGCFGDEGLQKVLQNSDENMIKFLNAIRNSLNDKDMLKLLITRKYECFRNIFHLSAINRDTNFHDLLPFCDFYLEKDEIKEMLVATDELGHNVVFYLNLYTSNALFTYNLQRIGEFWGEDEWFKQFLKSLTKDLENIFHLAAYRRDGYLERLLQVCAWYLTESEIKEMLFNSDKDGENAIQKAVSANSSETLKKNLRVVEELLGNDELLKQIFRTSKNGHSRNIFHLAAGNSNEINPSFFELFLSESETANLLVQRDKDGCTALHIGSLWCSRNILSWLDYANEKLKSDRARLEELFLAEDKNGNTFLHCLLKNLTLKKVFDSLPEKISNEVFVKLLNVRNENGQTFLFLGGKIRKKNVRKLLGNYVVYK